MTFIAQPFLCTVCRKQRENDANHWFLVYMNYMAATPRAPARVCVTVEKWVDELARSEGIEHACGQECMQTLVERWVTKGSLT